MTPFSSRSVAVSAVAAACVAAGCGGGSDYSNKPRPPAPINVTAAISAKRVSISPATFGAGPIVLIVSNQTATAQTVTFQTEELGGDKPGLRQTTSPINPRATATLQVDVREGSYAVSTRDKGIQPASVEVGRERKSAQDRLLEP